MSTLSSPAQSVRPLMTQGPFAMVARMWQSWAEERHLQQAVARLAETSDHLLDDAGLVVEQSNAVPVARG